MRKQTSTVDIERRIQICRYEIVAFDQDIKAKVAAIGSFNGDASTLNSLCQSVRSTLEECEAKVGELERLSLALPKSNADALHDVTTCVKRHRQEMGQDLKALRDASKRALDNVQFDERQALLAQSADSSTEVRMRGAKLSQQGAEFSDQLEQVVRQMDAQVRHSEETLRTLASSSQSLGDVEAEFRSMGATVHSAGRLLSKLNRREITDRVLFALALMFFFGTAFYIVKKRLFGV